MKKNVSNKYPTAVNIAGTTKEYIGIIFNGDRGVYRKDTIKALKKEKDEKSKKLLKAVKAAEGDIEISRLLIEADRYDILIDVFNGTDCRTVIIDYLDNKYQLSLKKHKRVMNEHLEETNRVVKDSGGQVNWERILRELDEQVDKDMNEAMEELEKLHNETASDVFAKYQAALDKKLKELKAMQEELKGVQDELEEMLKEIE